MTFTVFDINEYRNDMADNWQKTDSFRSLSIATSDSNYVHFWSFRLSHMAFVYSQQRILHKLFKNETTIILFPNNITWGK